ncbi:MAG: hypothetical protein Q8S33_19265 [Myxococcales bacterium]|nr:hypothetical protein [Myxococcales bacterium]
MNDALTSLAALEVACDEGVTPHLARLDEAIAGSAGHARFVLARVREALAIHLSLLQHRPDALWPVLYAHTAFVDAPRARTFGVSAPGPDMPMFEQVGRWLTERKHLHPDTPWLRALTPTTPWGESLIAELRTLEKPRVVSMTDDEVLLEAGATFFRWRWATGSVTPVEAPPPAAAELVVRPRGGGLALQRGSELTWLVQPGWSISSIATSPTRVACLAWDGDEGITFVFDLATRQQLASLEASATNALALSPDGAWLAWGSGDGVTSARHLDSGVQAGVNSGAPSSVAVSSTGRHLAVVEDGVVRVARPSARRPPRPFVTRPLPPAFTRDGSALLLGQFVLDGTVGSVRLTHRHHVREYLEGGPAPFAQRLTPQRLCVCEAMGTETVDLTTGRVTTFSGVHAAHRHRVAWSGDGLTFAVCRHGSNTVTLHSPMGERQVQTSGLLEALALDQTGSQLALLDVDGTVELQAGGTRLRRFPGATGLAFLANDRAIAVGGRSSTVVLGLDGTERWSTQAPFVPTDAVAAGVEWRSGLRAPSPAEALALSAAQGLLAASDGARTAVFPSTTANWVRSPSATLLAHGTTLLSWEAT